MEPRGEAEGGYEGSAEEVRGSRRRVDQGSPSCRNKKGEGQAISDEQPMGSIFDEAINDLYLISYLYRNVLGLDTVPCVSEYHLDGNLDKPSTVPLPVHTICFTLFEPGDPVRESRQVGMLVFQVTAPKIWNRQNSITR
jgi:hypothetical protein